MNSDAGRTSAKIYQFPVRPRASAGLGSLESKRHQAEARPATISFGSAWYHEAAIQEDRSRKS